MRLTYHGPMQAVTLDTIDLVIIAVYLAAVFVIGFRVARRTHDADDLFLAGRRLGWIPIGLSLFASNISSTTLIGGFEGLFHYLQTALAFLVPPVVVIFLFGLCCRRAGAAAALATLAGGHAVSAGCFIATLTGVLELHFTLIAGLIFGVSAVIYTLVYRATRHAVPAVAERYVWHPATARATVAGGWWRDDRVHGAALLLLTLWLVLAFA